MDKQVVLAQEVRDYPMVFFVMIGIAYFYALWLRRPQGGSAFGYVLLSVIGLYLHYYCYMVNLAILVHAGLTLPEGVYQTVLTPANLEANAAFIQSQGGTAEAWQADFAARGILLQLFLFFRQVTHAEDLEPFHQLMLL